MSNEALRKAVERFDSHFAHRASSLSRTAELNLHEWQTIRQALHDQEAEIAELRERVQFWKDASDDANNQWQSDKDRAEKAEALLREFLTGKNYESQQWNDYRARITAHLGGEHV